MKTKAVIFIFIIVWLGLACSTGKSSKKKNNNTSPEVSIIYPSKGQIFFKLDTTSVLFKGKAIDTEDGELSGENLSWFISDILIGKGNSISISMSDPAFLPGDALIILKAVDSNHAEGSASVKIKIAKSHPEVRILSPINNSVFLQYETVHFSGNARDVNLNLMLYGEVLKWSSNKDNFLGYDSSFTTSSLSPGEHIIRFIATNRENVMDSAFIKIVINRPPTVNINSVLKKYYATTDVVNLNAFAEDPDEGILLNNNSFVWISAQEEGKSWIGHTIELDLSGFNLGEHILKIRATDSLGCSAYDSVSIITKAMLEYPQVKIKSPEQGTVFEEGDNIIFLGEGLDAEDGDLPEDVFIWTSVKDKKIIGTGKTITFSGLSIRYNHDIILEVHDSENNYSYDTVTIVVNEFNNSPIPVIISPRSGGNEDEKKQVLLKGYGTDYEDGVMADTSLRWQSSIDGFLGNYKEIFTGNLSSGNHILSLIAKDSKGKYGSTAVNFTINPSFWLTWTNGNIINCMAAEGNVLWAGTTGGLVRWNIDSKTYGKFTTVDGLINNNIKALAMDTTNKDLWIGTSSGLCKYSFETTWHFESYTSLTPGTLLDNDITSLTLDKNRKLWIGTSIGLNCYDPAVKAWQSYTDEIPHVPQVFRVSALDIDNNNELWIGTNGGGVARFDSARNNWTYYTSSPSKLIDNEITAISHDNAGNIWFGTYSSGVSKFNGNNLWTNYTSSYYGLINNSINSIMTDKYGKIWFGTLTGVSSLNNNSWKSYDDNGGLILNNNVSFITYDDNNNIYMGTNAGINKFAPDNNTWTFLEIESDKMKNNSIKTIAIDNEDFIWLGYGVLGGGINKFKDKLWEAYSAPNEFRDHNIVKKLYIDNADKVWLGTKAGIWVPEDNIFFENSFKSSSISAIITDSSGITWAGSEDGYLYRYYASSWEEWDGLWIKDIDSVTDLKFDISGKLWIGSYFSGIASYDISSGTLINEKKYTVLSGGISDNTINSILTDNNKIWIATNKGLDKFENSTWQNMQNNLQVNSMVFDEDYNIWMGTSSGVYKYEPATGFLNLFNAYNGLADNNVNSVYIDNNGQKWFGTSAGLNLYLLK